MAHGAARFATMSQRPNSWPQQDLPALLADAVQRRRAIAEHNDCYRLIDAEAAALPGVGVEVYGKYAVLLIYRDAQLQRVAELAAALQALGFAGVYCKPHLAHSDAQLRGQYDVPVLGEAAPDPLHVHEGQLRFAVSLCDGLSTGLFLDQRDNRTLLCEQAAGARVLNLFCYTGSFTVAAAVGGALGTVSVDVSARALRRCGENLELNGRAGQEHRLLKADAGKWLERAVRRGDPFDFIVLDPPSFARQGGKSFSAERDYSRWAQDALRLLAPGGRLLAVMNHRGTTPGQLLSLLQAAARAARRSVTQARALPAAEDCCDEQGRSSVKSVLVEVSA
jgi:23S rRNA (cytosine1962-C5)-methyltransferase